MGNFEWWNDEEILKISSDPQTLDLRCKEVVKDLENGIKDIAMIVENLGPLLTAPEVHKRKSALVFLSETLGLIPKNLLNENQLKFIVSFYNDRLKDNHSVIPAVLVGIAAISTMVNVPEEEFLKLLFAILGGSVITCQSQQREERSRIFDLIQLSSVKYEETLLKNKVDFIQGVINAIEGERDPRNLLKLFSFMPDLIKTYPLEHWAEEMFEVFACYYPIDFYPSANDPNSITRDLLAEKLQNCLLATEEFIEHLIPLALEKLESQLKVAKLDSLSLLTGASKVFGTEKLEEKIDSIWIGFKLELLPGQNDEIIEATLNTLGSLVGHCATKQTCDNVLNTIFHTISISLCDINLRLFGPSIKICFAVAKNKPWAAVYVTNKVMPIFVRQLEAIDKDESENIESKLGVLKLFNELVKICNENSVLTEIDTEIITGSQAELLKCVQQYRSSEMLNLGFDGLAELASVLLEENRKILYKSILEYITSDRPESVSIYNCIKSLAKLYYPEMELDIVKPLVDDILLLNDKNAGKISSSFCLFLDTFDDAQIETYTTVFGYLINLIFLFKSEKLAAHSPLIMASNLKSLNNLLKTTKNRAISNKLINDYHIFKEIVSLRSKFTSNSVLSEITILMNQLIKTLETDQQQSLIDEFLNELKIAAENDIFVLAGFLANCSNDVNLGDKNFERIVSESIDFTLNNGDKDKVVLAKHILCFLFNRTHQNSEVFEQVLNTSIEKLRTNIEKENRGIPILAWIIKGLLIRGHPKADELIVMIINYLTNVPLSKSVAEAFEIISKPPTFYLPNVKLFYKQKLFSLAMKNMLNSNSKLDCIQLKAFGVMLGELPMVILRTNLSKVGPIICQCLQVDDPDTLQVALDIVNKFIKDLDQFSKDNIQFLVPQLLELSRFKENMRVRLKALECLLNLCSYPVYMLLPFKLDVQFGLEPVLDDHKRLVRISAAQARCKWFLVDAPQK